MVILPDLVAATGGCVVQVDGLGAQFASGAAGSKSLGLITEEREGVVEGQGIEGATRRRRG